MILLVQILILESFFVKCFYTEQLTVKFGVTIILVAEKFRGITYEKIYNSFFDDPVYVLLPAISM